jgi:hypothetical protein
MAQRVSKLPDLSPSLPLFLFALAGPWRGWEEPWEATLARPIRRRTREGRACDGETHDRGRQAITEISCIKMF